MQKPQKAIWHCSVKWL